MVARDEIACSVEQAVSKVLLLRDPDRIQIIPLQSIPRALRTELKRTRGFDTSCPGIERGSSRLRSVQHNLLPEHCPCDGACKRHPTLEANR